MQSHQNPSFSDSEQIGGSRGVGSKQNENKMVNKLPGHGGEVSIISGRGCDYLCSTVPPECAMKGDLTLTDHVVLGVSHRAVEDLSI